MENPAMDRPKSGKNVLMPTVRDNKATNFAKLIFLFIWNEEFDFMTISDEAFAEARDINEAVVFLAIFMRKVHVKTLRLYLTRNEMSKESIFRFYRNYCFNMYQEHRNIFFVLLHSLTLAYFLEAFCSDRGHHFRPSFRRWWEYVFNENLKQKFYSSGAWLHLKAYIAEDFFPPLLFQDYESFWNVSLNDTNFDFSRLESPDCDQMLNAPVEKVKLHLSATSSKRPIPLPDNDESEDVVRIKLIEKDNHPHSLAQFFLNGDFNRSLIDYNQGTINRGDLNPTARNLQFKFDLLNRHDPGGASEAQKVIEHNPLENSCVPMTESFRKYAEDFFNSPYLHETGLGVKTVNCDEMENNSPFMSISET